MSDHYPPQYPGSYENPPQYSSPEQPTYPSSYPSQSAYPPPPPPPPSQPLYPPQQPGYAPFPQYAPYGVTPSYKNSGLAIASLICGIVGLCPYTFGILPLAAVICGHLALSEINKSNGMIQGRGMAIAGLVLGYIVIGLFVIGVIIGIAGGLSSMYFNISQP